MGALEMEIDPVNVVGDMNKLEAALGDEWENNQDLITAKARATADYDEQIALQTTAMKASGDPVSIIKEKAKGACKKQALQTTAMKASGDPVSIIKEKAKGACKKQLYDKILAEEMLKAHYVRIDILRSQLSAKKGVLEKFNLI
jgi:hypothetical protein